MFRMAAAFSFMTTTFGLHILAMSTEPIIFSRNAFTISSHQYRIGFKVVRVGE
jgi:hypothetical protein